jgi:hypothetical protein
MPRSSRAVVEMSPNAIPSAPSTSCAKKPIPIRAKNSSVVEGSYRTTGTVYWSAIAIYVVRGPLDADPGTAGQAARRIPRCRVRWPAGHRERPARGRFPETKLVNRELDDRFHETARLDVAPLDRKMGLFRGAANDSNFGSARLGRKPICFDVRIPTKPARHSNMKPATRSEMKPAMVPI